MSKKRKKEGQGTEVSQGNECEQKPRKRDKHNVWEKGLTHCGASAFYFCVTVYSSSGVTPPQITRTSVQERYFNLEIIEECNFSVFIFGLWD